MVLLIASWGCGRVPVAFALMDPTIKGHQNILFRQMLKDFIPPSWVRQTRLTYLGKSAGVACSEPNPKPARSSVKHAEAIVRREIPESGCGALKNTWRVPAL